MRFLAKGVGVVEGLAMAYPKEFQVKEIISR